MKKNIRKQKRHLKKYLRKHSDLTREIIRKLSAKDTKNIAYDIIITLDGAGKDAVCGASENQVKELCKKYLHRTFSNLRELYKYMNWYYYEMY